MQCNINKYKIKARNKIAHQNLSRFNHIVWSTSSSRPPQSLFPMQSIITSGGSFNKCLAHFYTSNFVQDPLKLTSILFTQENTKTLTKYFAFTWETLKFSPSIFVQATLKFISLQVYEGYTNWKQTL